MKLAWFAASLAGLAVFFAASAGHAEKRVALVIGNATYEHTQPLANPRNDADDLASALKRVGFDVALERDLDKRGMERAIAQFARDARDADAALFYYAGHGLQHRGLNYLMPADARLDDEFSLNFEMTRLDDVLLSLGQARGVRILVLDACRRNPLVDRLAGVATTRDFAAARGLARLNAGQGMVVAYATQADQVAADGRGRNSPFTAALVRRIDEPGLEIGTLFRRVAADVNRATGGRQLPELSVSLLGEFYFTRVDSDVQAWAKVRGSQDPKELQRFIDQYTVSPLVVDARERLETLTRAALARIEQERIERDRMEREAAEREQLVREREERLAAQRPQLPEEPAKPEQQADRITREQGEREAASREKEAPKTIAPPGTSAGVSDGSQVALLQQPSDQARTPSPSAGDRLVVELKKELKRIGCYSGAIDESWPTPDGKASLQKFVRVARLPIPESEPTDALLEAIRSKSGRVCPSTCNARQVERDGRCIAKTCPVGFDLDNAGNCEKRRTANLAPSRPAEATRNINQAPIGGALRKEPPAGSVPMGTTVLIDDGSCPRGSIKEITGGNLDRNVPRTRRCVARR